MYNPSYYYISSLKNYKLERADEEGPGKPEDRRCYVLTAAEVRQLAIEVLLASSLKSQARMWASPTSVLYR